MEKLSLLQIAEKIMYLRGKPISMKDYVLFYPFYQSKAMKCLLMTARQVAKSTSLSMKQVLKASLIPHKRILTIHPLKSQSTKFSRLYVDSLLSESPILKDFKKNAPTDMATLKQFSNGSELHFNYIKDDPGRVRGTSVEEVYFDETQDLPTDHIVIVEQCTAHCQKPKFEYCGTPRTKDNTMAILWGQSSQGESVIKCSRCSFENYCMDLKVVDKMLNPKGLSCQKCSLLIQMEDVYAGYYTYMNPEKKGIFDGFHIPQIFMPFNLTEDRWKKILLDRSTYGDFQFATEVLGFSYDVGGKPITLDQLTACCSSKEIGRFNRRDYSKVVIGVDWGVFGINSFTVVSVIGLLHNGKFELLYVKKFSQLDRAEQRSEICALFKNFGANAVGVDHGAGYSDNFELRKVLGTHVVFEMHYSAPNLIIQYLKDRNLFSVNRTKTLDLLFTDLRKKHIVFPKLEIMRPFFEDILAIYEDIRETPHSQNKFYSHNKNMPDDFAHSLNFAIITIRLLTNDSLLSSISND